MTVQATETYSGSEKIKLTKPLICCILITFISTTIYFVVVSKASILPYVHFAVLKYILPKTTCRYFFIYLPNDAV
jgi:hypothetical protein